MIDPSTGLTWGIDPDTGEEFTDIDWPLEDDELMDPSYQTDLSIFGVSPVTGVHFGIDPSTNEPWHCNIIDSDGEVYNTP